jgi:pimeloyl-ACP methyl ester carboxylesterase
MPPTASPSPAPTAPAPATPANQVLAFPDVFVYVPTSAAARQPATVLVALHGMGGEGRAFCKSLIAEAERNGWILLSPTFRYYENWHDPAAVLKDDVTVVRGIKTLLDRLPEQTGLRVRKRALFYGFSRGSQVAHRFALAYPQRVLGVAAVSAGAYTLPVGEWSANGGRQPLPLPFGTADLAQQFGEPADPAALKQVTFWVAVGGNDNREADVPGAWTPYIGPNRLARARAFKAALDRLGAPAVLTVFPGAGHNETPEMRAAAAAFLRGLPAG